MSLLKSFFLFLFTFLILNFTFYIPRVSAVVDPLSVPNNRIGVHILEPGEIFQAARLVNSNGGNWGYVTVPIRSDDRDREKWIRFFVQCGQNRVIPIVRLATYIDGDTWVAPTAYDLIDFANFLNDMPWPVKNRYVIIFNEPNHSREWGGRISASEYASILIQARDIFKSRSDDFFILNAGMDMSSSNTATSMDALLFYRQMSRFNSGWYAALDGFAVHAYPNPGFSASPLSAGRFGIASYRYELKLLQSLGYGTKPVFITETGYIGDDPFYKTAFTVVWRENNIVAVTPFVLFAGAGDFLPFSLTDPSHQPKNTYLDILGLPKIFGSPLLNPNVGETVNNYSFSSADSLPENKNNFLQQIHNIFFPPAPRLTVGNTSITVEISETAAAREKGLSGRKSLAKGSGMLFTFPQSGIEIFWMKEMNFALDFVWINKGRVVNLTENIPPPSLTDGSPMIISSVLPIDKVLEVNAGFIKDHLLKNGDMVMLNSP